MAPGVIYWCEFNLQASCLKSKYGWEVTWLSMCQWGNPEEHGKHIQIHHNVHIVQPNPTNQNQTVMILYFMSYSVILCVILYPGWLTWWTVIVHRMAFGGIGVKHATLGFSAEKMSKKTDEYPYQISGGCKQNWVAFSGTNLWNIIRLVWGREWQDSFVWGIHLCACDLLLPKRTCDMCWLEC